MTAAYSLANPSKNLTEYIAQLNRLVTLTKGNCTFDTYSGPSLTIDEDFLKQGKIIPANLHGRLTINPTIGFPDALDQRTREKLTSLIYSDDDPVYQGYVKKYNLTDDNTYVVVYDLSAVNIHTSCISLIMSYIDGLNVDSTVVFIITGTGAPIPDLTNKFSICGGNHELEINVKVTPLLEWGLAVKLASVSNKHVLTNTAIGTLCAKLNATITRKVWAPVPLKDNSVPDRDLSWYGVRMPRNSTRMFDWIYYINMEKRVDRKQHMEQQLMKFNLAAARVVGVDGKSLPWHPNLGATSTYWNGGALGYCLSYQNALIDAIKNNFQHILIMDDDAVLTDNFLEVLEKAYDSLPNDWHMLYLAANHNKDSMPTANDRISNCLYKMKGSIGSHAIIINRPAFQTILNYASTPYGPLDVYLSVYQQICPCYITYPGLATQLPGRSDIIDKEVDYAKDWGVDYINHIEYLKNDVQK